MLTTRSLTPAFGIEVSGTDLSGPVNENTRKALYRPWVDAAVPVIRDQRFSPEQFEAFARMFGEPMEQQAKSLTVQDHPLVGQWNLGDVAMCDNRSVMHQANSDVDPAEHRSLYRIMLEGAKLQPHGTRHARVAA